VWGFHQVLEKLETNARATAQLKRIGRLVDPSEMRGMWVRDIWDWESATVPAGKNVMGSLDDASAAAA